MNTLYIFILYGALALMLIACALTDARHRLIPNLLTFPMVLLALSIHFSLGGWDGVLFSLGGFAFGFAAFLLPYLLGGMGAGDVKLMSGVGAALGFEQTTVSFLFIVVCGGILALGFMIHRRTLGETLSKTFLGILYLCMHRDASLLKVQKNKKSQECIPYGVAIAGGVFLFFFYEMLIKKSLPALPYI